MENSYRICTRCIMDTTDPDIQFDENGVCNHCRVYDERVRERLRADEAGQQELNRLIAKIKTKGKNKKCDCIIGVSGGVDSTFAAYMVKKLGLRPLAVHLDNGWDSEVAVANLGKALKKLDIDLYTYVVDWEEFKDVQLSFLRASVPDAEIPTDYAIRVVLYQVAAKEGIQSVVSGGNVATEGHLPAKWSYGHVDWKYIRSVHKKFGKVRLKTFPHRSLLGFLCDILIKRITAISILNYTPYVKKDAMEILEKELDWKYYGGKHYESIYTRFLQAYILPRKFGIDKRKSHLSTLICSGQMTREEALEELKNDPYRNEQMMRKDRGYVLEKLGLSEEEFDTIMSLPIKTFRDYPSNHWLFPTMTKVARILRKAKLGFY